MATTKESTALANTYDVALAIMDPEQALDMAELREELGDDAAALGMALFTRVKMPSGGGRAFEIEDADTPDAPEVSATIEGVVVAHHSANAYWSKGIDDGGDAAPDCSSKDGRIAHGNNGDGEGEHECGTCALNEFGSASNGGKACKNTKNLFVLRPNDTLPLLVSLPPASIKAWQTYLTKAVLLKHRKAYGVVTRIGIEKVKNAGGIEYSRAMFSFVGTLTPEQAAVCKRLGDEILPLVTEYVPALIAVPDATEGPF